MLVNWVALPLLRELLPSRSISLPEIVVFLFLYPVWVTWAIRQILGDYLRAAVVVPGPSFVELLDLRDDIHDETGKRHLISIMASQIIARTVLNDKVLVTTLFSDAIPQGAFMWIPGNLYNKLYKTSGAPDGTAVVNLIRTVLEVVADLGGDPYRHRRLDDFKQELASKLQTQNSSV